jgi:hypothetical protein
MTEAIHVNQCNNIIWAKLPEYPIIRANCLDNQWFGKLKEGTIVNQSSNLNFPGGSKSRVNRAGDNVRSKLASGEDLQVIEEWRAAHRAVLNTFQAILRNRTRGTEIVVAQRHKRKSTIYGKLDRFPGMKLARMDDVAGCRLIFKEVKSLKISGKIFIKLGFAIKGVTRLINMTILKNQKVRATVEYMMCIFTM